MVKETGFYKLTKTNKENQIIQNKWYNNVSTKNGYNM